MKNSGFSFIEILLGLIVLGTAGYFLAPTFAEFAGGKQKVGGIAVNEAKQAADAASAAAKVTDLQNKKLNCELNPGEKCPP